MCNVTGDVLLFEIAEVLAECQARARNAGRSMESLSDDEFEEVVRRAIAVCDCGRLASEVSLILKLDRKSTATSSGRPRGFSDPVTTASSKQACPPLQRNPVDLPKSSLDGDRPWTIQEVSSGVFRGSGRVFFDTANFPGVRQCS